MQVIGIDPGLKGGVCVINNGNAEVYLMEIVNDLLRTTYGPVYIERQVALSGQAGAAKTMQAYGQLIGWAEATLHRVVIIDSKTWYRHYGIKSGMSKKDRKMETYKTMSSIYPDLKLAMVGPRGAILDGLSDALAIAHYGFLQESKNDR